MRTTASRRSRSHTNEADVVLQTMLPKIDGFEVCKRLGRFRRYILMLCKTFGFDRIRGLEGGATLILAYSLSEVVRIRAVLRRTEADRFVRQRRRRGRQPAPRPARTTHVDGRPSRSRRRTSICRMLAQRRDAARDPD